MANEVQGQFGGRVTCKFGTFSLVPTDAEINLDVSTFDVKGEANQDGSASYEMKPKLVGVDIEFRNVNNQDWDAILLQYGNVTITETTGGRTHLFTNTRLVGTSKVGVSTGAVKGLRFEGGSYQKKASA
jgi:hypothetical protein